MNILKLAERAGFSVRGGTIRTMHSNGSWVGINQEPTDFAQLVAQEEREACAGLTERRTLVDGSKANKVGYWQAVTSIAADIRARAQAKEGGE